jgi:hypothetical protein
MNNGNSRSTAVGFHAMKYADYRSSGRETFNTAVGSYALRGSTVSLDNTGQYNTAVGDEALYSNTSGSYNTASGSQSLYSNSSGSNNTAIGRVALYTNSSGGLNTALGYYALYENSTGSGNTAIGPYAGQINSNVNEGTFVGRSAYSNNNDVTNVTAIGYAARNTASYQIRIGNSSITSIGGYEPWSDVSDAGYKSDVREEVAGLDFILRLRPVTYHLDVHKLAADLDEDLEVTEDGTLRQRVVSAEEIQARDKKSAIIYTGLIAQEVEEAAKSIGYDFSGVDAPDNEKDHYGLRYSTFVVPLIKAVQEQQTIIEELKKQNAEMLNRIEALEKN